MARKRNRKHSKIDKLDPPVKLTVEDMISSGYTYHEIVEYLKTQGVEISGSSVHRYAKSYMETVSEIKAIQDNFRAINDEISKTPDLDVAEAIIQIMSQKMLNVTLSLTEENLKEMDPKEFISQLTNLVSATTRKRRADAQNRSQINEAIESVKVELYEALSKERPDLWRELNIFLESKRGAEDE